MAAKKKSAVSLVREVKPSKAVILADISSIVPDANEPFIRYNRDDDQFISFPTEQDAVGCDLTDCDGYDNITNILNDLDFDYCAEESVDTAIKLFTVLKELAAKTK
jgi:hypothetical protein